MTNNQDNFHKVIIGSVIVLFLILNITFNLPVAAFVTSLYISSLMFLFMKKNWKTIMKGTALTEFGEKLTAIPQRLRARFCKNKLGSE
jgi:hypothetical protein